MIVEGAIPVRIDPCDFLRYAADLPKSRDLVRRQRPIKKRDFIQLAFESIAEGKLCCYFARHPFQCGIHRAVEMHTQLRSLAHEHDKVPVIGARPVFRLRIAERESQAMIGGLVRDQFCAQSLDDISTAIARSALMTEP